MSETPSGRPTETGSTGESETGAAPPERDAGTQRRIVRERYADIAAEGRSCCGDASGAEKRGYDAADVDRVAEGANLDLGCGNPTAIAGLSPGETVLDLGSGAGFDCFLAAREVGPGGRVIGVDMTPEMVEKARDNAATDDSDNVEFRLGEIEHLPVADGVVDAVISNCVVNLSPDKPQVFAEAFRALRPGGRLAVSDVVLTASLPAAVREDPESLAACVSGASTVSDLEAMLDAAGFVDVAVEPKDDSAEFIREWDDERDLSDYVLSATIEGRKPADGDT